MGDEKKKKSRRQRGNPLCFLSFLKVFCILLLCFLFLFAVQEGRNHLRKVKVEKMHTSLSQQFLKVAELTVIKVNYSDCVGIKKSAVAGMSRAYSIVKFSGTVRVGIRDAGKIRISISDGGDVVRIVLPKSEILDETIVSQEVFDEKQGLFVNVSTQDVFDEITVARKEKLAELKDSSILSDADRRTGELMQSFASSLGACNVYINLQ